MRSSVQRRLRLDAVGGRLGDVGEEIEIRAEPEHAIATAASDLGENAYTLQLVDHAVGGGKGHAKPFLSCLDIHHRLLEQMIEQLKGVYAHVGRLSSMA